MTRSLYPRLMAETKTIVANPAAGAETIVGNLTGIASVNADDVITFDGQIQILSVGTTAASLRTRIRRNSITGTVVYDDNADNHAVVAAQPYVLDFSASDQPGEVASLTYVITLLAGGGTAQTTLDSIYVRAICW